MIMYYLSGVLMAFLITYIAIPVILKVSDLKNLNDMPGEDRKVHRLPVSPLGGVGIFGGFTIGLLLSGKLCGLNGADSMQYIFACFLIAFLFGVKDDILVISPFKKFLGQLIVACILVFKAGLVISHLNSFMGIGEMPYWGSIVFSVLSILGILNAFNLVDGLDGLAATLGALAISFFSFVLYLFGDHFFALLGFVFTGSLVAFLRYNFAPARVFMGEVGAMLIGIITSILFIRLIQIFPLHKDHGFFGITKGYQALCLAPMIIPMFDMIRLFCLRLLQKKSPFSADRNHLHHLLFDFGFSHRAVVVIFCLISLAFMGITYLILPVGVTNVIMIQGILFYLGTLIILVLDNKRRAVKKAPMLFNLRNEIPIPVENKILEI